MSSVVLPIIVPSIFFFSACGYWFFISDNWIKAHLQQAQLLVANIRALQELERERLVLQDKPALHDVYLTKELSVDHLPLLLKSKKIWRIHAKDQVDWKGVMPLAAQRSGDLEQAVGLTVGFIVRMPHQGGTPFSVEDPFELGTVCLAKEVDS
ncbi:hypothetical protein FRC17_004242 [Serendipita sp. 399]|nr:hypothetical protein FRC17_004242 [Serendipita sp. 399]